MICDSIDLLWHIGLTALILAEAVVVPGVQAGFVAVDLLVDDNAGVRVACGDVRDGELPAARDVELAVRVAAPAAQELPAVRAARVQVAHGQARLRVLRLGRRGVVCLAVQFVAAYY